jgi:hypothetical protein
MQRSSTHYEQVHQGLVAKVLKFQQTDDSRAFKAVEQELLPLIRSNTNSLPAHQRDDAESLLLLAAWRAVKQIKLRETDPPETVIKYVASILKRARFHMLRGFSHYRGTGGELDTSFRNEFPGYKVSLIGQESDSTDYDANAMSEQVLSDEDESTAIDRLTTQLALRQAMSSAKNSEADFDRQVLEYLQKGYDASDIVNLLNCSFFRVRNAKRRLAANGAIREAIGVD